MLLQGDVHYCTLPRKPHPVLLNTNTRRGGASNASCTPESLTSRTADPWSPHLQRSPGPSAGPNTTSHTVNAEREKSSGAHRLSAYIVLGVRLHADGAKDLLSGLHGQIIIQVEDRLLPVGVGRLGTCEGHQHLGYIHTAGLHAQIWLF